MEPEEKFEREIWEILQKIKTSIFYQKKGDFFVKYKQVPIESKEEREKEESLLEKVEDFGAIKIIGAGLDAFAYINKFIKNNPSTVLTHTDASKYIDYTTNFNVVFLDIQPKFDEVYKEYEEKFSDNNTDKQKKEQKNKIIKFDPLFSPKFDGKEISMPSIEEINKEKKKDLVRMAAKSLLDKLELKEEIKKEIKEEIQNNKQDKTKHTPITIKNISLDERNYLLEINNGENILPFKCKKKGSELEEETKFFKVLYHLWDFRRETKGDKILSEGSYVLLKNIKIGSGCLTEGATYQQIKRLNARFQKENLPINIEGKDGKYLLVINKT